MKKVNLITQDLVFNCQLKRAECNELEAQIINRIDYILNFIFDLESSKLNYWYFDGAQEGAVGNLNLSYDNKTIYSTIDSIVTDSVKKKKNYSYILKDGKQWEYEGTLPSRWLFEDFEEELIEGKKKYELLEVERKQKKNQISEKNNMLVEQAKAKLSKEELAALKKAL